MTRRGAMGAIFAFAWPATGTFGQTPSLDGSWGAYVNGLTAQVIVAGGAVIGFFWRGDYVETTNAQMAAGGASLTFQFKGGGARLVRTGEATASLEVSEGSKITRLTLKRD